MTLTRITILQLGDVHFADAMGRSGVDQKDVGFPAALADRISLPPFQAVIRSVQEILQQGKCDAIVIMGDITTKGDKAQFQNGIDFLSNALWNKPGAATPPVKVLLVPGNHDVNREDAKQEPLEYKFKYINASLSAQNIPVVGIDTGSLLEITANGVTLPLMGINTCVGCGTLRSMPDRIKSKIQETYDAALAGTTDPTLLATLYDELYETLDTPAVTEASINWVIQTMAKANNLAVIFGHHNLIPQIMPRIAPYTELINGGTLRAALLATKRKLIYLHGHIHTDPIDLISSPEHSNSFIASISAPQLVDGFNFLELEFSADGSPLGCVVNQYRYRDGLVSNTKQVRIALNAADELAASDDQVKVMKVLSKGITWYWRDLVIQTKLDPELLKSVVEELLWQGRITLDKKNSDNAVKWVIGRGY
jgi:3',5'-cyclic AMP phosphodiesterase CpdA